MYMYVYACLLYMYVCMDDLCQNTPLFGTLPSSPHGDLQHAHPSTSMLLNTSAQSMSPNKIRSIMVRKATRTDRHLHMPRSYHHAHIHTHTHTHMYMHIHVTSPHTHICGSLRVIRSVTHTRHHHSHLSHSPMCSHRIDGICMTDESHVRIEGSHM